ncbi:MAG TPA: LON peptidase substrate-binding domain-containing protein, partial [Nocardioidaceae bacterium]|nr:LON peptidase substrate-binding domain-containing protein [Nocardioidaceae bacterium]
MTDRLPMFPLNTVLFPGVTVPLHVFEDRYRALVHHLLTIPDRTERVFGVVAIREGYEVGSHGAQSVHRIGCVAQMTTVAPHADGRFDIEVVGRQRMRLDSMDTS